MIDNLPSKENPIEAGNIIIYPDTFVYENKVIELKEIQHISFYWERKHLGGDVGPIKSDYGAQMEMSIILKQPKGNISSKISHLMHNNVMFDKFLNGYKYLSSRSFKQRYDNYFEEFRKNGYFYYDSKKFTKDGNVEWMERTVNLYQNKLVKNPFSIEVIVEESIIDKLKRIFQHFLFYPNILIKTEMDQDVLFELLKNVFKLNL